ncbi:o-succinylbenzoate--CoA ligase [Jatrophihabitans sp. YIM 134969]
MRTVAAAATPASVAELRDALRDALAGGPAVLPLPPEAALAQTLLDVARPDEPADDVALLVPTSGSTGTPKLVELSADAARASVAGTELALGGPGQWALTLPTTHIAGLQVLIRSILAGTEPVVHGPDRFTPGSFTALSARLVGSRRYTALVPTQLRRLLASEAGTHALVGYDAVLVGGAATSPSLLAAARDAGAAVVTTYGMSETAGGCLYDGRPIGGATVDLDPTGRILLGGPTLARGYRGEPELTAAAFVDGRFVTSDLGRFDDGRLQVLGRADDVVISGGVNVHPLAVEAVIATLPGVRDVCVAGVPDPEWGAVVTAWVVGEVDAEAVRAAVRAALGAPAAPRRVERVAAIPLLVSGKPDRRRLVTCVSNL